MATKTEYTAEMAHAAAARGGKWMDEHCPDWVKEINLKRLNLQSSAYCVLGQTARCLLPNENPNGHAMVGGFGLVAIEFDLFKNEFDAWLGFSLPSPYLEASTRQEQQEGWAMLTLAWRELIRERLEAANV